MYRHGLHRISYEMKWKGEMGGKEVAEIKLVKCVLMIERVMTTQM